VRVVALDEAEEEVESRPLKSSRLVTEREVRILAGFATP
jgi:hypothetical protein